MSKSLIIIRVFLMLMTIYCQHAVFAQRADTASVRRRLNDIKELYSADLYKGNYVTSYIMDSLITETQNKISGVLIKEGKTIGTTASVEDKSVTVNHSLKTIMNRLAVQLTASGSSEDNVVDIFTEGKYRKTITAGFNFNIFPHYNSARYLISNKWKLWNQLYHADSCFELQRLKEIKEKDSVIAALSEITKNCQIYLCRGNSANYKNSIKEAKQGECETCSLTKLSQFNQLLEQLSDFFPDGFSPDDCASLTKFIDSITLNFRVVDTYLVDKKKLSMLNSIQGAAPWTSFKYTWFSGSTKLNQKVQPLLDPLAEDKLYTRNYHDFYFSASLGYNYMFTKVLRNVVHYFYPTISFDNERDFDKDSLITVQAQQPFQVNSSTLVSVKSTSFYPEMAARSAHFAIELPYILYFPKTGVGLDIAVGTKFSDKLDNLYGRIGFYVPISVDKDNTITIEPIIRLNKLNKTELSFLKDQLSFGFNISVSIPRFLSE